MTIKEKPRPKLILVGCICLIIGFLIGLTFEASTPEERKERVEEFQYMEECQVWKVCDYREQIPCFYVTGCPEEYECWEEKRECKSISLNIKKDK